MKKYIKLNLIFICCIFFLFSCNNENAFDCIKSKGKIESREIATEDFSIITIYNDVNLYLSHGTENKIIIKAGKNIIPKINLTVSENNLTISNDNTCNWARKYGEVDIYITSNNLEIINFSGYGDIKSLNTLTYPDLTINNDTGNGNLNLEVNSEKIHVFSRSYANITLTGTVNDLSLEYYYNHGRFYGQGLKAKNVIINHFGLNAIAVHPLTLLNTHIGHSGNVEYYNEPANIEVITSSTGKLVNHAR
ncbi:hypothetical protein BH23BAC1_BH23BAC1_35810 [soil metagenome]